jgi:hypothetical protein
MRNPREILGRGWGFPFQVDPARGSIGMSEFEENIRQCMTIIIGTRPGERQMLPTFGCRVHEMLFAPNTSATASQVAYFVKEALDRWEKRIQVLDVKADPDPAGAIKLTVQYKIKATEAVQQLSYTVSNR